MTLQRLHRQTLLLICLAVIAGCGGQTEQHDLPATQVTFICLETRQTFELAPQPQLPAVNPLSGRPTLVPAYLNPRTGKWQPIQQAIKQRE